MWGPRKRAGYSIAALVFSIATAMLCVAVSYLLGARGGGTCMCVVCVVCVCGGGCDGGWYWSDVRLGVRVCCTREKPHPFVRLGQQFDASTLPGASAGHEPLDSRRVWVRT